MKIGISGSNGLIGKRLAAKCKSVGHEVVALVRSAEDDEHQFNPWQSPSAVERLSQLDVVVHLAGRRIDPPWTKRARAEIRSSRIDLTSSLAQTMAGAFPQPQTFIVASAIGIYGDCGETLLHEKSPLGEQGFLPQVAKAWEQACGPAIESGIRVVHMRFGVVLDAAGGALGKMLLPARWGLNGPLGNGQHWFSWISLADTVGATLHCIDQEAIIGPVNAVAPNPIRNADFSKALGRVLHRPAFLRVPAFALRWVLGDAANELLLASTRVAPQVLLDHDYRFIDPALEPLLTKILGSDAALRQKR